MSNAFMATAARLASFSREVQYGYRRMLFLECDSWGQEELNLLDIGVSQLGDGNPTPAAAAHRHAPKFTVSRFRCFEGGRQSTWPAPELARVYKWSRLMFCPWWGGGTARTSGGGAAATSSSVESIGSLSSLGTDRRLLTLSRRRDIKLLQLIELPDLVPGPFSTKSVER